MKHLPECHRHRRHRGRHHRRHHRPHYRRCHRCCRRRENVLELTAV